MTTAQITEEIPAELTDDEVEELGAMFGHLEAKPGVGRDALGRFCKLFWEGEVSVWSTVDGQSHSHEMCGTFAKAVKAGHTVTHETAATGWLCTGCVAVEVGLWTLAADVAPSHGEQACKTCDEVKGLRKFPTVEAAPRVRDRGDECRACQSDRRTNRLPVFGESVAA